MKTLDSILQALEIAADIGTAMPGPIGIGSALAAKLIAIAEAAAQAHLNITGQPIDLAKLHVIEPVK